MAAAVGLPAGFVLDQPAAPHGLPAGFMLDEEAAKPEVSTAEALGRGALQGVTAGFADELTGAGGAVFARRPGESLVQAYRRHRDEARAANAAAHEAHPIASTIGEIGGGVATAFVPGLNVAKGASLGAVAANAGAQAAAYGLGSSDADLTKGEFGQAAIDTAKAGAAGAVLGSVLHGVGQKIGQKAEARAVSDFAADASARSKPTDQLRLRRTLEAGIKGEGGPGAGTMTAKDVVFSKETKPILKAARAKEWDRAVEETERVTAALEPKKDGAYKLIEQAHGPVRVGAVDDHLADALSKAKAAGDVDDLKSLTFARDNLHSMWGTATADEARAALRAAADADPTKSQILLKVAKEIPDAKGPLNGGELRKSLLKAAGVSGEDKLPMEFAAARDALDNLPKRFDPNATVPPQELRRYLTKVQTEAATALGTIEKTRNAKIKEAIRRPADAAMDEYLGAAASKGDEAAKAVTEIRNINRQQSILLNAKAGYEQAAQKAQLGKKSLGETGMDLLKKQSATGAVVGALATGNPALLGAAAIPKALELGGKGLRLTNDAIARIVYNASQGDARALQQLSMMRRVPALKAKLQALATRAPAEAVASDGPPEGEGA